MSSLYPCNGWEVLEVRGAVLLRPVVILSVLAGVARIRCDAGETVRPAHGLRKSLPSAVQLLEASAQSSLSSWHEKSATSPAGGQAENGSGNGSAPFEPAKQS